MIRDIRNTQVLQFFKGRVFFRARDRESETEREKNTESQTRQELMV